MTKRKEVEKKIRELVPELQELSFGCEVSVQNFKGFAGHDVINTDHRITARQCKQEGLPKALIGSHLIQRGYLQTDFHRIAGKRDLDVDVFQLIEVIGHPIRLEHVLMAIKKKDTEDELGEFESYRDYPMMTYGFAQMAILDNWTLTLPFSKQSDEVINLLHEILV